MKRDPQYIKHQGFRRLQRRFLLPVSVYFYTYNCRVHAVEIVKMTQETTPDVFTSLLNRVYVFRSVCNDSSLIMDYIQIQY